MHLRQSALCSTGNSHSEKAFPISSAPICASEETQSFRNKEKNCSISHSLSQTFFSSPITSAGSSLLTLDRQKKLSINWPEHYRGLGTQDTLLFLLLEKMQSLGVPVLCKNHRSPFFHPTPTPGQSSSFPTKFKSPGNFISQSHTHTRDEYESWAGICSLNFAHHSKLLTFNLSI